MHVPPPPPPPPPPPSSSSAFGGASVSRPPPKTKERDKLLHEIHAGARLRKTVTNDRSAPLVGGLKPSITASRGGAGGGSAIRGGVSGGQGIALHPMSPASGGSLFINGLPKKPSDNKKTMLFNNAANQGAIRPRLPAMPKPSSTPHFTENKSNVNNLKAAFDAPYSEQKTSSAPNLDTTSANPGSGVSSSIAERVELLSQKLSSGSGMSSEPETSSNQATAATSNSPSSIVSSRLEHFNNQNARPSLAPPPTPSAKMKPALPNAAPFVHKTTPPSSSKFNAMRSTSVSDQRPIIRRASSEDIRSPTKLNTPPALPANPPNSSRIVKPAHRPPPPPGQPARLNQQFPNPSPPAPPPPLPSQATLPHAYIPNNAPNTTPSSAPFKKIDEDNDDDAPPRPPPRGASYGISTTTTVTTVTTKINKNLINNNNIINNNNNANDLMDRFTFIPISELPPPNLFTGFKKIYDSQANKRSAVNAING